MVNLVKREELRARWRKSHGDKKAEHVQGMERQRVERSGTGKGTAGTARLGACRPWEEMWTSSQGHWGAIDGFK